MKFKLVKPDKKYKDSFYNMIKDYSVNNELDFPKYIDRENDSFEDHLKNWKI